MPRAKTVFVVGIAGDKDVDRMLERLAPQAAAFVFTRTGNPRAAPPEDLAARLAEVGPGKPADAAAKPAEALDRARELVGPADRIVVTGSMYLAGDILRILRPAAPESG
jgi:dihydrofolate synthase/folylpolyglutamate synthase